MRPETICVEAGYRGEVGDPVAQVLYLSTTYHQGEDGTYEYIRDASPTIEALERVIGTLDGGHAVAFASGMAAATAVLDELTPGARVVAPEVGYLGVRKLLAQRHGTGLLDVTFVDGTDTAATTAAIGDGCDLVWAETPNNPMVGITDLEAVATVAHAKGAKLAVDATLATPLLQRTLELGADYSVHSATKYIAGHADSLLGVVVAADETDGNGLAERRNTTGAVPGPFEVYLGLRGVRTLALRMERSQANAAELARRLSEHPAVGRVLYPGLADHPGHELARKQMNGFGAIVSFEIGVGAATADAVCAGVEVISNATSLGGVETLIERRARYPEEAIVPANLVRISVGIEHVEDLWADLERAISASYSESPAASSASPRLR
jgi:cystathionine gamma-synthase